MLNLERLYLTLPLPLQQLACSVEGWRIRRARLGRTFLAQLAQADSRTFWSFDQIERFRDQRLQDFVRHCEHTCNPYYRRRFRELGITHRDIRSTGDLRFLPVLTKDDVKANPAEFVSDSVPPSAHVHVHTSGTTGGGLRFETTRDAIEQQWATWWRYRGWHGITTATWCAYFGGRSIVPVGQLLPPFWRTNRAGRQLFFSAYHLNEKNLPAYADKLREARLPWLHGYPSLLSLVAAWILDRGFDLGYRPHRVTVGSENLLEQQAELIERGFGVRPVQHYGMAEAVANISECEDASMHVDEDFAVTEFVPDDSGHKRIVGTNVSNCATPLLRYDTQDIVSVSSKTCPCGRPGRVIEAVDGRQEDYVVLKNGVRLGRLDHIFKDLVHVREAQIEQRRKGAIVVRIVRGAAYSTLDEAQLLYEFRKRVGTDLDIQVSYINALPRSTAGKLRFVVSQVEQHQLGAVARSEWIST